MSILLLKTINGAPTIHGRHQRRTPRGPYTDKALNYTFAEQLVYPCGMERVEVMGGNEDNYTDVINSLERMQALVQQTIWNLVSFS